VITVVLLDLAGGVVGRFSARTPSSEPPEVIAVMGSAIRDLIASSGVDRARIAGVGVAAPGPIDALRGTVLDPPLLRGWHHVHLRDRLADAIGLPVVLEKDTAAAAVGELWTGRRPADDTFVFLYLGTGIGAALALDGDVVRGRTRNLGEIGHIVVDPDGPVCGCGTRGCVAVTCSPAAIVRSAERLGALPAEGTSGDVRSDEARLIQLCAQADAGDSASLDVLRRAAEHTATLVAVLSDLLDVDRVVVGGPFWSMLSPVYLAEIPPLVDRSSVTRALRSVSIDGAVVGDDVGAVGAACVVLDAVLTPRTSALLLAPDPPDGAD
jgi:predicted NBD/HSP70 family sugar kinase